MNLRVLTDDELAQLRIDNPGANFDVRKWCPTCKKKNKFGKDTKGGDGEYRYQDRWHHCECEEQMQLFKHYLASGIGTGYHRLGWSDYVRNKDLSAEIAKYVDNHAAYVEAGVGFIFTGLPGTGKTLLSILALKELVRSGYRCHATSAEQTTSNLTATWRDNKAKRRYEDIYVRSDVLLLDDVGRELIDDRTGMVAESNKFKETVLDTILRTRVQYSRPTFLTTNLSPEDLESGYGGAVGSLLTENSIVKYVSGEDFRPAAAKRKLELIDKGEVAPIV